MHAPVPLHAPLQPTNVAPAAALAASVTLIDAAWLCAQLPRQETPGPVTAPATVPVTVSAWHASVGAVWPVQDCSSSDAPMMQPAPNYTVFEPPAFAPSIAATSDTGSPDVPEHAAVNVAADAEPAPAASPPPSA